MIGRTTFWRPWLLAGILATLILSCKSSSAGLGGAMDANLPAKAIIRNHYKNQLDFKTLSGRINIDYTDGESSQSFSVSLRLEKDKAIWISAPLGIVKAYITPDRVSFYNKLQNEYFDGDFAYLSNLLGTELDFEKVQNLLLGQAILDLREGKYNATANATSYELKPIDEMAAIKTSYRIEPQNFKIETQQLSQPLLKRLLEIRYKDYQQKDSFIFPNEIGITSIDTDHRNVIDLEYRNIEINRPLSFPYEIPSGYDKILLK